MKAIAITEPGSLSPIEQEIPEPGPGEIRIRVAACGVCHGDHVAVDAMWPGIELPRVPGHEVAGTVDAVGEGVAGFEIGAPVGVGWHGGHDGTCAACVRGRFNHCENGLVTGISFDGGYAESVTVSREAVAAIPDGFDPVKAAPLLCAGVTTFNALRNSGARAGDLVAVQGLGGLGHLGIQYARAMGFEVAAISRGTDKAEFARDLGAHFFVDSGREDFAGALGRMGGARVILATAPDAASISALVPALGLDGCLMVVGAPFEPLQIGAIDLISRSARIMGWSSGTAADSEDALRFAAAHGIETMTETFPLADARAAYDAMMAGTVRFRAVLVP